MKKKRQQKGNEYFVKKLSEEVGEWCEKEGIEPSLEATLAYLVKHNLLRQSNINKYVAIKGYQELRDEAKSKQQAIYQLTNLLPLEERQIWNLLSNHYVAHKPNGFKFP